MHRDKVQPELIHQKESFVCIGGAVSLVKRFVQLLLKWLQAYDKYESVCTIARGTYQAHSNNL